MRLDSWFAVWHPNYRRALIALTTFGAAIAVVIYLENSSLEAFGRALRGSDISGWLGAFVPLGLLAIFAAARLVRLGIEAMQRWVTAWLGNRARTDLERAILEHLLRKEDGFFASRPPAEILNRLNSDISRINGRRTAGVQRRQSAFVIAGNLYFFATVDLRLTAIAIVAVIAGAVWMRAMTRPVAARDKQTAAMDDRVKARFEDLLRAAPEIQVGNLGGNALRGLAVAQHDRTAALRGFWSVEALLNFVVGLSNLIALVALVVVGIYVLSGGSSASVIVLVPVIIKALPEMFTNAAQFAVQGLHVQYAETSGKRLLEYESASGEVSNDANPTTANRAITFALQDVAYRYTAPDGRRAGGVTGVSMRFEPGSWVSIVGGSGAGKSTVTQLLLGRLSPESGTVTAGDRALVTMSGDERAALLAYMPQTVMLFDASIRENLLFGHADPKRALTADELALIRSVGLADISGAKALDLPVGGNVSAELQVATLAARAEVARGLALATLPLRSFGPGHGAPQHPIFDAVLGGRSAAGALDILLDGKRAGPTLDAIARSTTGEVFAGIASAIIERSRALLGLPYAQFAKLSPIKLDERVFQLRAGLLGKRTERELVLVALTATYEELDGAALPAVALPELRQLLGSAFVPYSEDSVHPHLTWRENLVHGVVDVRNQRVAVELQRVIDDVVAGSPLAPALVEVGLDHSVGRGGARLSGGQRQLVALCRTLLRKTPIVVLDEPTSALDPQSRDRVAALLARWKADRVIITVSHDMELVRASDAHYRFEGGRLVAHEVHQRSAS